MAFSDQLTANRSSRTVLSAVSGWVLSAAFALPAWSQDNLAAGEPSDSPRLSDFSISQQGAEPFLDHPLQPVLPDADEFLFNPYDLNDLEPAIEAGIISQEAGQHETAVQAFEQALQITRIRYGLYSEVQIPILEGIIASGMQTQDWEMVDQRYAYMENLYRKLYALDDPRLENGLQKISSFHVNAFNNNLDGRREYHLRRAATLFQTRLRVAENTLAEGDPRFDYLNEGIAISRQHLYLMSTAQRENQSVRNSRERDEDLLADLD